MTLDRQRARELAQALLRARNMRDGSDIFKNAAQASGALGEGSYGEPVLRGKGFPSALRGTTTGGKAGSQSQEFVSTPRPLPFRDPVRFSYVDEVADSAKARGLPAHDQLAFNEAPSLSSWPANLQATNGKPLAALAGIGLQQRYWGHLWERLFPSYCPPSGDNLTFPLLIYQDKAPLTEADKDACDDQFDRDEKQCYENHSYKPDILRGCLDRAKTIHDLCLRGETETLPWNDFDSDGVKLSTPGKKKPKKR